MNMLLSRLINSEGQLFEILLLKFRLLEVCVEWEIKNLTFC